MIDLPQTRHVSRFTFRGVLLTWSLALLWSLMACGPTPAVPPSLKLLSPTHNTTLQPGEPVIIQAVAFSQQGLESVTIRLNDQTVHQQAGQGDQTLTAIYVWTPTESGNHTLAITAIDHNGLTSQPLRLALQVNGSSQAGVALPTPMLVTPTTTLPPGTQPTAQLTANTILNLRAGPSLQAEIVGTLDVAQTVTIIGRDAGGEWWLIYNPNTKTEAWVSANPDYSRSQNTQLTPVVAPESRVTPVATKNAAAPAQTYPTIHYFRADRNRIPLGGSARLEWDFSNATQAYLHPGGETGIQTPGSLQVSPGQTTRYQLTAANETGEVLATLTVEVSGTMNTVPPLYDFTTEALNATWQNNQGEQLPFNGPLNSAQGAARLPNNLTLENGQVVTPSMALQTVPPWVEDGQISGYFPLYNAIPPNTRFQTQIGFAAGATATDGVTVQFCYRSPDQTITCLGELNKTYTESLIPFEVDLSALNGYNGGWFELRTNAAGTATQDWVVWVSPQLRQFE